VLLYVNTVLILTKIRRSIFVTNFQYSIF